MKAEAWILKLASLQSDSDDDSIFHHIYSAHLLK